MAFVELSSSALAPGVSPVRIHYRDVGAGRPLVDPARRLGLSDLSVRPPAAGPRGGTSRRHSGSNGLRPIGEARAAGGGLPPSSCGRNPRRHRGARARAAGALGPQRRRGHRAAGGADGAGAAHRADRRSGAPVPQQAGVSRVLRHHDGQSGRPRRARDRRARARAWRRVARSDSGERRGVAAHRGRAGGAGRRPVWRPARRAAAADADVARRARSAHRAGRTRRVARRIGRGGAVRDLPGGRSQPAQRARERPTRSRRRRSGSWQRSCSAS